MELFIRNCFRLCYRPVVPYDVSGIKLAAANANSASKADVGPLASGETLRDIMNAANQRNCGLMFLELWGAHSNGFPQPKGCFAFLDQTYNAKTDASGVRTHQPNPEAGGTLIIWIVRSSLTD